MNSIIAWFARNGVAANLLMVFIVVSGVITAPDIKREVFPEFSAGIITVAVQYPGATPEEVEEGVCVKVEETVQGLPDIKKTTSTATENLAVVSVELLPSAAIDRAMDDIKARVDAVDTFPAEIEKPVIEELVIRKQVINVAVHGAADERALRHYASRVRDELLALPEITQVELSGIRPFEVSIEVSEHSMRRYGVTFDEVARAVRLSSLDMPAGSIKADGGEILLRTQSQAYSGRHFEEIVLRSQPDGTRLLVGDVAAVVDEFEELEQESWFNGQRCALVKVFRVGNQSALELSEIVHNYITEASPRFPEGIHLEPWQDDSTYLRGRLDLMMRSGLQGFALVFLVLALFLRFRLAIWASIGIPISFLGTIWLMPTMDVSVSMISLFAFIVVLGVVVDDAILIGENIHSHHQAGNRGLKGSIAGAQEMAKPVIFAVLTSVAAFLPLVFVAGNTGKIMKVIPFIVMPTLLFSLIESLIILPEHLSHLKEVRDPRGGPGLVGFWRRFQQTFVEQLETFTLNVYRPLLKWVLRWRYLTLATAVALFVMTLGLVQGGWIRFVFFPPVEGDNVAAMVTLPLGVSDDETRRVIQRIEKAAKTVESEINALSPEGESNVFRHMLSSIGTQPFRSDQSRAGGNIGSDFEGAHFGEVHIEASPAEKRLISSQAIARRWRELAGDIPEAVETQFTADIFQAGDAVDVVLTGTDFAELRAAADELKKQLAGFDGVHSISDSFREGKEEVKLRIKPGAQALGLTQADLAKQVRQAFYGEEVQRIQRGRDDVKVMVRYPRELRQSVASLEGMRIRMPGGRELPFSEVSETEFGRGYESIRRVDQRRAINITADVDLSKISPSEVNDALEDNLLPQLKDKFPGVLHFFEGEKQEQNETLNSLAKGYMAALIIIFALLAIPFGSYVQPFIVMSAIPFGLIGAVWGHVIMGMDITILSGFGVVALTGVVVNDSLVMVDFVNRKRKIGLNQMAAAREAGEVRFRPILLTSLTTFAGLSPLLLEKSLQARFLMPMAVSLGFGVIFATLITLLLVPSCYLILEDIRALFRPKSRHP